MKRKLFTITLMALLALLLIVGGATSQGPEPEGEAQLPKVLPQDGQPRGDISAAATVNSRISYQGVLKESGTPVNNSRDMIFRLYSDSSCTTLEDTINKPGVTVTDGLFSVELDVDQDDFNGQGLWMQVGVGGTTVINCQEILPAPYALSLRPGAIISGTNSYVELNHYSYTWPFLARSGLYAASEGTGLWTNYYGLRGLGDTAGVYGRSDSTSGRGVYGYASASSGNRYGVRGDVNGTGYGLYTSDNLYVSGSCTGCIMAFIAHNTSGDTLQVGDVVAVSGVGPVLLQGHTTPVLEVRRATAGDASVLGVVYSRGEFYAASGGQPEDGDSVHPVEGDVAPGDYLLVVTSGLAQVRVAKGLTPGQRLTVGNVAGQATLAGADAKPGLVFARAMEAQPDENGLLWAMISD